MSQSSLFKGTAFFHIYHIKGSRLSLIDGSLRVVYSQDLPVTRYSLFAKEHVISQFTGGNHFFEENELDQNEMVFLITVPTGTMVTAENAAYLN